MCELLLQLVENTHPDPAIDLRGCWKPGYVIRIEEDGFLWARKESIETWVAQGNDSDDWHGFTAIIKIPGVPKASMEYMLQSLMDVLDDTEFVTRRRAWRSNLDLLPVPIKNQIYRNYVYTATENQWNAVVEYLGL